MKGGGLHKGNGCLPAGSQEGLCIIRDDEWGEALGALGGRRPVAPLQLHSHVQAMCASMQVI